MGLGLLREGWILASCLLAGLGRWRRGGAPALRLLQSEGAYPQRVYA